jgi:hypothetical protein
MQITPEATVVFQLAGDKEKASTSWLSALPDALAFGIGLALAWWAGWGAGDLIWSLWLSSIVVGYATIVWMIGQPAAALAVFAWRTRHDPNCSPRTVASFWALILVGASFMLAFFTVHFVGFHYIQSGVILGYFPIDGPGIARPDWSSKAVYLEIWRRYWVFLPSAFLSHRAAFLRKPLTIERDRLFESMKGAHNKGNDFFVEPYKNVARIHLLLFCIFLARFAGLENFGMYAVIYVVYFFPWRLVRGGSDAG